MTSSSPVRVFISSASGALCALSIGSRRRVPTARVGRRAHGGVPARSAHPRSTCAVGEVERCDVLVLLLAHRYGITAGRRRRARTPSSSTDWARAPTTRWRCCRSSSTPDFPWPPRDVDRGADAEALAAFVRTRADERHIVRPFGEPRAVPRGPVRRAAPRRAGRPRAASDRPRRRAHVPSAPALPRGAALRRRRAVHRPRGRARHARRLGGVRLDPVHSRRGHRRHRQERADLGVDDAPRAPHAIDGLAGRLWWSFYDGSASMTRFLQRGARLHDRPPARRDLPA